MIEAPVDTADIRAHYDTISRYYKIFWGNHIHHGYWEDAGSPAAAQTRLMERLASLARVRQGASVLDVGCGIGGSSVWLAREFGCSVLGLTISRVQVDMGRGLAVGSGVADRVSFRVHDANCLDEIPDRFGLVWAIESTEHLQDKDAFVRSAARCLAPGGALALCAWLVPDGSVSAEHRELATAVCEGMLCPSLASGREYRTWMERNGFRDIRFRDVTPEVERTWEHCARIARRREVRLLLRAVDHRTRRFVAAFDLMRRAYRQRALRYGMFAATLA